MKNTFKKLIAIFIICFLFSSFAHATEHVIVNDLGIEKNMKADFILPDGNGPFPPSLSSTRAAGYSARNPAMAKNWPRRVMPL